MELVVLESVPFQIDMAELKGRLRMKEGSPMTEKLEDMVREAQGFARPKACFGPAFIESKDEAGLVIEGLRFSSRVMRVNMDKVFRVFPYVATCGPELEQWSKSVDGMLEQFWAEGIKESAVRWTVRYLNGHLAEKYQTGPLSRMSPGSLPDWPLSEQQPLFTVLNPGPSRIGVQLKESFLMTPVKSVSGIFFPAEERFESCMLCQRENCPGRRAPYDPGLYDRKYRKP
ncbi:MAG TPA: vitamin B12 dependent-methionine synthase activation domain-containing protein [Thermodesulfobacteriota bacterium]|nr:vitamin B12 dependent-methionine synthase activation domain-containing protein [Thermodesulfobacteriota bacterium]